MTLVKTKLRLEELGIGDLLTIRLRDGEARVNVPRSLREQGQAVIDERPTADGCYLVVVRKEAD